MFAVPTTRDILLLILRDWLCRLFGHPGLEYREVGDELFIHCNRCDNTLGKFTLIAGKQKSQDNN